ncbi:kelch domain-containing protein [Plasmodium gonderi]|uniref:Kelch domain-containing protein n=1 Tax=Plasmodium gonderi TaxID=77519 RepID=A0A1Y1JR22_PLAGO|nr:kelch domain-containing protein [Plasmodium gonderi]GAW82484.1 kelch domain-containing protein [Plasmodium gonderi]
MSYASNQSNLKDQDAFHSAYSKESKECTNIYFRKNESRKILTWNKLNGSPNCAKTNYKKMNENDSDHVNGSVHRTGYWNDEKVVCFPRRTGAASVLYKNHIYIFGGYRSEKRLNDFYKYNITENQWTQLDNKNCPSKRENNPAFLFKDKMYILGGYQGNEIWLNDFYSFDFNTEKWELVHVKKESIIYSPPSLFGFAISVDQFKGVVYLFGGYDGKTVHNKMYAFDLDAEKWIHIQQSGDVPSPRSCAIGHISDGYFYLFGGYNGEYGLNIFYQYHLDTGIWTRMKYNMNDNIKHFRNTKEKEKRDNDQLKEKSCDDEISKDEKKLTESFYHHKAIPMARYFMGSFLHNKSIYILGGYNGLKSERLNDLYKFDIHKRIWFNISTCNNFTKRSSMNTHFYKNAIYCIAGFDGKNSLNDVYALKLDEVYIEPPSLIQYYKIMVNNYRYADVIFVLQNKYIYGCSCILLARCPSFKSLFDLWVPGSGPIGEKGETRKTARECALRESFTEELFQNGNSQNGLTQNGLTQNGLTQNGLTQIEFPPSDEVTNEFSNFMVIPIYDTHYDIFLIVINYLYTDELSMNYSLDTYMHIVLYAYKYGIFRLMQLCERSIGYYVNETNVMDILILSYRISCKQLCISCIDFIINNKLLDEAKINRLTLEPYLLGEIYKKWIFN